MLYTCRPQGYVDMTPDEKKNNYSAVMSGTLRLGHDKQQLEIS